jgi:hypothetical protein
MFYTLVGSEDGSSNITVFVSGQAPLVAHSSHANFDKIVEGARANDGSIVDLFDVAKTAVTKFERLTERVSAGNGRLYFDGVEVHDALASQVVRFLAEGVEDWKPLVNFYENIQSNPNEHSREQLYTWLEKRPFTITPDGMIVGYKGVTPELKSINHGTATVDGVVHTGAIPNAIGSVIEMPRDQVAHDSYVGCSTGLHVGTYEYAESFARGALLEVHVNPRDVVSVPTDCDAQKVRTCRYKVVKVIDAPHTVPVASDWEEFDDEFDFDPDEFPLDPVQDDLESVEEVVEVDGEVKVGDVFEDTDSRRQGRTFKVESIEGDYAVGKSLPQNVTRKVRLDRLTSRKYRKA